MSFSTLRAWAADDDHDDAVPATRRAALERVQQRQEFVRRANATPDSDLSAAGRTAWRIAHIVDPDAPPEAIRARLKHELWRSANGWHARALRGLTRSREAAGKPLDPESDEELRRAWDAAFEEEFASLIPNRQLARVPSSSAARFTFADDEYARQRPYLEARRAELAERIEAAGLELRRAELRVQLRDKQRELVLARCRERGAAWTS